MASALQPRWVGAGALVRFDATLAARIRDAERLDGIVLSALSTILIGAGAYGAVFGMWHSPLQAVFAALKLPLVFLGTIAVSLAAGVALAAVLRSGLSAMQSMTLLLVSFAGIAALLGSLAPVVASFVWLSPPPDPAWIGLDPSDPRVRPALEVHHRWLLSHVAMMASCALVGVWRLRRILESVLPPGSRSGGLWLSWVLVAGFVGAELSWLARPFQGTPTLGPSLFRAEPLAGNFFESVWRMLWTVVT